jgi:hypothetical protein
VEPAPAPFRGEQDVLGLTDVLRYASGLLRSGRYLATDEAAHGGLFETDGAGEPFDAQAVRGKKRDEGLLNANFCGQASCPLHLLVPGALFGPPFRQRRETRAGFLSLQLTGACGLGRFAAGNYATSEALRAALGFNFVK